MGKNNRIKNLIAVELDEMGVDLTVDDEPKKDSINNNNFSKWINIGNNTFIPTKNIILRQNLEPGNYNIVWNRDHNTYGFARQTLNLDELLMLPNPNFDNIINDMVYFWNNEEKFKKYNYAYKRGILLYGNPGCGKSCLTALLSDINIKNGGIVLNIKNSDDLEYYLASIPSIFRMIQPKTPILTVLEDLDGLLAYKENETELLNLLDGFNQCYNTVYIGCTNYPENLKERILNRPSRFDKKYYIGPPDAKVREFYFNNKIKKEDKNKHDIKYIVEKTDGLTLAHLGELIKSVYIFEKDLDSSINELIEMGEFISSTKFDNIKKSNKFFNK
jgi:energy-coupling factor transporter ATP-binding protein EcfA2